MKYVRIEAIVEAIKRVGILCLLVATLALLAAMTYSCVIASVSEAINRQRIPRKSARKAMAKPQHSAALKITIFDSPLLMILSSQPQRTRLCSRFNIDEALWTMTYASATHN